MTPIINPWWFYLFDITEKLGTTSSVVAALLGIGSAVYIVLYGFCEGNKIKFNKTLITIFIISTIFSIFTPTKETCYQMAAASLVTPNNLTIVGETATDIIDYIVDSVDKALEEDDE